MKVLQVYRTYFPESQGGLEEAIRQLCRSSQKLGVTHRIFTLCDAPSPAVISLPEAEVYRFRRCAEIASCSLSWTCLSGFKQLVAWADIIHYHFPWPFADLLHFICQVDKPSLVTYHADIVRQNGFLMHCYHPLMRRFLSHVDRIVATSPNYAQSSEILPCFRDKLHIIPIGIDPGVAEQQPADYASEILRAYGQEYFFFVGVLRYYKGLHLLLEAASEQPFTVVIAGQGPLEAELRQKAERMGLKNVHFTGYINDQLKAAFLENALAVVFPSHLRSEAFGVTLLEGAAYGKPLISAEIGSGMSYINRHRQTGLVIPAHDPLALRQAMLTLYHDTDLAQKLGKGAKQRFSEYFTAAHMGAKYTALYTELLEENPRFRENGAQKS